MLWLAAPAHALTAVELYARVSLSVWKVVIFDAGGKPLGLGSAVVVAPQTMVTNCHVVEKAHHVQVRHELSLLEAEVELSDKERDLCQLKVPGLQSPPVPIFDASKVLVGQNVYAIGNPHGLDLTMSSGLVSAIRHDANGRIRYLQTSAAISGGSSGGGLFDDEGRLLGLTTSGIVGDAQNLNFAIPADWVKDLWRRHGRLDMLASAAAPPVAAALPPSIAPPPSTSSPSQAPVWRATAPGDEFEYSITDGFTRLTRRVVYRVDRIDGQRVVFNDGARIESTAGMLLEMASALGGDMDQMAPPEGWRSDNLRTGMSWRLNYQGHHPSFNIGYELRALVEEQSILHTELGPIDVIHVSYTGWSRLNTGTQRPITLHVWVAPSIRRVVRFSSDVQYYGTYAYLSSREVTTLTAIRHAAAASGH